MHIILLILFTQYLILVGQALHFRFKLFCIMYNYVIDGCPKLSHKTFNLNQYLFIIYIYFSLLFYLIIKQCPEWDHIQAGSHYFKIKPDPNM